MQRAVVFAVCAVVVAGSWCAAASPGVADARASAMAHQLMSPFCPQLLLSDCRSSAAATLRTEIREALVRGASEDTVREELVRRYGEAILAAPQPTGFGLVAWLGPPLVVGVAMLALIARMRASVRGGPPTCGTPPGGEALRARLEKELRGL